MENLKQIVCITGASGMIGKRIMQKVLAMGFTVRVLSRNSFENDTKVELFKGPLSDIKLLEEFLRDSDYLFHCAAEINDENLMEEVNVTGTKSLYDIAKFSKLRYFCHMSSAGVIGRTACRVITEETSCNPMNTYERTKYKAEQVISKGIKNGFLVILRPVNVIDEKKQGVASLPLSGGITSLLKVFIKGKENAHLVHAETVAQAAIYFMDSKRDGIEYFNVSLDHEKENTVSGVWKIVKYLVTGKKAFVICLPSSISYLIRFLRRGYSKSPSVIYSSNKLREFGFNKFITLNETLKLVIKKS